VNINDVEQQNAAVSLQLILESISLGDVVNRLPGGISCEGSDLQLALRKRSLLKYQNWNSHQTSMVDSRQPRYCSKRKVNELEERGD
jgi:hypothetical protein